jgi:hypothetical protein
MNTIVHSLGNWVTDAIGQGTARFQAELLTNMGKGLVMKY